MKTIAHRLAFARGLSGLSARQLGLLSGLSTATVGVIESGDRPNPESATVAALARTLGVSMDWLVGGGGEEPGADVVRRAVEAARKRHEEAALASEDDPPKSEKTPSPKVPPEESKAAG